MKIQQFSFSDILKMILGSALAAAAFQFFTFPNSIVSGGVTGVAQIVHLLSNLPTGVLNIILNIPLFLICWRHLGLRVLIGALAVMIMVSVFIDLFALTGTAATDDPLLASVYGGVLNGAGYGLVYTTGVTGGGIDILAKLLRRKYPHINFGNFILGMNVLVVLTFAVLFHKYESCMYTMIEMFISSKVINLLLYGSNVSTVCYIISSVPAEISDAINREMHRGVTFLRGQGGWSGHDQPVILCVIKRPEIAQMRALVREVDEHAFFIVTEAKDVFGKNFENIRQED